MILRKRIIVLTEKESKQKEIFVLELKQIINEFTESKLIKKKFLKILQVY